MNIFQRKARNQIEGINIKDLEDILNYNSVEGQPEIDTIVFDSILLTNETKIKCIKNYYSTSTGEIPKRGKAHSSCMAVQQFYHIGCRPYECVKCHRTMLKMRSNKQVKPR